MTATTLNHTPVTLQQDRLSNPSLHGFTIHIDIDAKKSPRFIHYLDTFHVMEKASLSATQQGLCIKITATDQQLGEFILQGVQRHADVTKVAIAVA